MGEDNSINKCNKIKEKKIIMIAGKAAAGATIDTKKKLGLTVKKEKKNRGHWYYLLRKDLSWNEYWTRCSKFA